MVLHQAPLQIIAVDNVREVQRVEAVVEYGKQRLP